MHRKNLLLVAYCLLSFSAAQLHARPTQQYRQWVQGNFTLPGEIAGATNVSQLQPFLESDREFTRMAAVRRLGQIEGQQAVPVLVDIFREEQSPMGFERAPLVKLEIIRILRKTGTERAKLALLDILKGYWERGPRVKEKKGYRLDADFACVVDAVLRSLPTWGNDADVFEIIQGIALSDDVRELYTHPGGLGQTAWEAYLKSTMARQDISETEQSLMYLLDFMYAVPKPMAHATFGHIKYKAAFSVLQEYSESALSALATKLMQEMVEEDAKGSDEAVRERVTGLSFRRGCIRAALTQKARLSGQWRRIGSS